MENKFNLVDEPWLVVIDGGKEREVGLRELFERADELKDIAGRPSEVLSLYRLLFCITHRALGSIDEYNWGELRGKIRSACLSYLDEHYDCFWLFGDKPFLQIRNFRCKEPKSIDILDVSLSTGSNHTFYDHQGGAERKRDLGWIARKIVSVQSFFTCGLTPSCDGEIGKLSESSKLPNGNFSCLFPHTTQNLLTILKGGSVLETLHWNLLLDEYSGRADDDRPTWELDIENADDRERMKTSFLGRLVPLSRFIRILDESTCYFSGELKYLGVESGFYEPYSTVICRKEGVDHLRINPSRHGWRDLCSVLALQDSSAARGSLCLRNIEFIRKLRDITTVTVYSGGFLADKAKSIAEASWEYSIDARLTEQSVLDVYGAGLSFADKRLGKLTNAISTYYAELGVRSAPKQQAERYFWDALNFDWLTLQRCSVKNDLTEWRDIVEQAVVETYQNFCPTNAAREHRAFSIGRKKLYYKLQ